MASAPALAPLRRGAALACLLPPTQLARVRRLASTPPRHPGGTLHVVGVPIGNLRDLSPRAAGVLTGSPLVLAEDTRVARRVLRAAAAAAAPGAAGAPPRLLSCHEHNEASRVSEALATLAAGGDVAVVSDAGTPGVSDPGAVVVAAAHAAGARVSPVPGASALAAALSVAGVWRLNADHGGEGALFLGFLPRHGAARRRWLGEVAGAHARRTVVLFEAPHRVAGTLGELAAWHAALHGGGGAPPPPRPVLVARELTKVWESVALHPTLDTAARAVAGGSGAAATAGGGSGGEEDDGGGPRGEFTLVLHPVSSPPTPQRPSGAATGVESGAPPADGASEAVPTAAAADSPIAPPLGDGEGGAGALHDAVALVRELTDARGMRLSEAVAAAAAVSGVRRKALMAAVAAALPQRRGGGGGGRGGAAS